VKAVALPCACSAVLLLSLPLTACSVLPVCAVPLLTRCFLKIALAVLMALYFPCVFLVLTAS
jgi:hypothetical protein